MGYWDDLKEQQLQEANRKLQIREEKPVYPDFQSVVDNQGNLLPGFEISGGANPAFRTSIDDLSEMLSGINLNTEALEALREEGLREGPSAWANLMLDRQGIDELQAIDDATSLASSETASAWDSLASSGGLSAGAMERIARSGARSGIAARQGARRAGQLDRLNILGEDEKNRLSILSALPGMEIQSLQPELEKTSIWSSLANSENARGQEYDFSNRNYNTDINKINAELAFRERKRKSDFDLGKYSEAMKGYAAERDSEAIASQGGGTWVCTEVDRAEPIGQKAKKALRKFKVHCWKTDFDRTKFYFDLGNDILEDLKARNFDFSQFRPQVLETVRLIQDNDMNGAKDVYWKMISDLIDKIKTQEMLAA